MFGRCICRTATGAESDCFRIRMEALRDPCDSDELSIAIEPAIDCDGSECGVAFPDSEGGVGRPPTALPPENFRETTGCRAGDLRRGRCATKGDRLMPSRESK
jgi:hypothetical protein